MNKSQNERIRGQMTELAMDDDTKEPADLVGQAATIRVGAGTVTGTVIRVHETKRSGLVAVIEAPSGKEYERSVAKVELAAGGVVSGDRHYDRKAPAPAKRKRVQHIPRDQVDGENVHGRNALTGADCGAVGVVRNTYEREIGADLYRFRRCHCPECNQAFMTREKLTR